MIAFIDTNIPMYAAGAAHPAKNKSLELLRRVASGSFPAVTDAEVLQEILHRFQAIRRIDSGFQVFDSFLRIVTAVLPVDRTDVVAARGILAGFPRLTSRDAIHAAVMQRHGISLIFSFDRHFDGLPGIVRKEP